ncbi:MAG: sulfite exporter TauE/SafE family protein [Candidatus Marinimicrobia bacterium]|nr:sulfite exporter TauE/SafE family protein [Candidatus Neomarinimicrobiota bacterium]
MEYLYLIVASLFTSTISAMIGMGGGIILLGIMALVIPEGYLVVALHGMIQLVGNSTRAFVFRNAIKKDLVFNYFSGSIIGSIISISIIIALINLYKVESANQITFDYLKPLIGIYILWFVYLRKKEDIKKHNFFYVGILGGLTSIFIGAVGPLIAPFFLKINLKKEEVIANKATCQIVSHLGKVPIFIYYFELDYSKHLELLLPLMISVYFGTLIGKKLLGVISEKTFKILFKICLSIIAVRLIIDEILKDLLFT